MTWAVGATTAHQIRLTSNEQKRAGVGSVLARDFPAPLGAQPLIGYLRSCFVDRPPSQLPKDDRTRSIEAKARCPQVDLLRGLNNGWRLPQQAGRTRS